MAIIHIDTDLGVDTAGGTGWGALAKKTAEGFNAVALPGDIGFIKGSIADTAAVARTLTSAGTETNPIKLIAVLTSTTNVGAAIVPADFADKANLMVISTTAAANLNLIGVIEYIGINLSSSGRFGFGSDEVTRVINGRFSMSDRSQMGAGTTLILIDTDLEPLTIQGVLHGVSNSEIIIKGGAYIATADAPLTRQVSVGKFSLEGFDLSTLNQTTPIQEGTGTSAQVTLSGCTMNPLGYTLYGGVPATSKAFVKIINSSGDTGITGSVNEYSYESIYGTVKSEVTIVRTGGDISYAMLPRANATLEGSQAALKSPVILGHVTSGSKTVEVYISNSSAATNYLEHEVVCELFSQNELGLAGTRHQVSGGSNRFITSTTPVPIDATSTWAAGGNNPQKFVFSINPSFEGVIYARVYLGKRQATPDTLYLSRRIVAI